MNEAKGWTPANDVEFSELMSDAAGRNQVETFMGLEALLSDIAGIVAQQFADDPDTRDALLQKAQSPVRHGNGLASLAEEF